MALRNVVVRASRAAPKNAMSTLAEEFAATPAAVPYTVSVSDVKVSTLANGMKVVSKETGSSSAAVGVAVGAGSRHGIAGEALVLKHLAFKGTTERSDIKLARDIEAAGLAVTSSADRDTVFYGASGAKGAWAAGLEVVAESVLSPKLVDWHVAEVKAESVAVELKTYGNAAGSILSEKLHEAAYGEGTPMGGSLFASPSVNGAALSSYVGGLYTPANMTLVGAGMSHAELVAAAEGLFPKGAGAAAAPVAASPFAGGSASFKVDSEMTAIGIAFPGAAVGSPDYFSALVLKQVLAAKAPCASAFSVSYADSGLVGLTGGASAAGAGGLAEAMVAALKSPVDDAAVAAAKLAVKTQLLVGAEDSAALLPDLAAGSAGGFGGVNAVTAASVNAFLAKMLKAGPALATVGSAVSVPSHAALANMF